MAQAEDSDQPVFIIIGRVSTEEGGAEIDVHIMLKAADDDSAIREALNALSEDGYAEASFDQIGTLVDMPDEEPHASAYQGASEGEVAIVAFDEIDADDEIAPARKDGRFISDEDEDYDPFAALKDWKPE